ncbi:hypothetical protein [Gracilinema caldarium]|uniref:hypothetical protein n=1 Tax=Gracilinema caldarium TaxID=215591 RepID=UPI0026F19B1B|nr:hypothetical protein [Gracilinema caldarium]
MKKNISILVVSFTALCVLPVFGAGRAEVKHASTSPWSQERIIPVYVLTKDTKKNFVEEMYVPQGIAAYYPNQFTMNSKERRIQFENRYSYRILEKHQIKEDVWVYSIETSSGLTSQDRTKTFTVYFNRTALIASSGEAIQPATYALERGARMSGLSSGTVRLETLVFNEKDEQFKAVVAVSAR